MDRHVIHAKPASVGGVSKRALTVIVTLQIGAGLGRRIGLRVQTKHDIRRGAVVPGATDILHVRKACAVTELAPPVVSLGVLKRALS